MRPGRARAPGRITPVAVAGVVMSLLGAAVSSVPAQALGGCGVRTGAWTEYRVPDFPVGAAAISAYAVAPRSPKTMFVTNGKAIAATTDGACSWRPVLELSAAPQPDAPYGAENATVASLHVPEHPGVQERVIAVVDEDTGPVHRPHIVISDDAGRTWHAGDAGLPPAGRPEFLSIAPGDHRRVLLGLDTGGGTVDLLYGSNDGGRTWSLRSRLGYGPAQDMRGATFDPTRDHVVWAWGGSGLYRSDDSGRNFSAVEEFTDTAVAPVEAVAASRRTTWIWAVRPQRRDLLRSEDSGRNWLRIGLPGKVTSSAHGHSPESMFIAAAGRVFLFARGSFGWFDLQAPARGITDLSADRRPVPSLYGHTGDRLYAFSGRTATAGESKTKPILDLDLQPPPEVPSKQAVLSPRRAALSIPVGDSETVTYRLALPRFRQPLDVFFLVDTSDSMEGLIKALLRGVQHIIAGLHDQGVDAQFGVGQFRTYSDSPENPAATERDIVYERVRDVLPFSESLELALEGLEAEGGGPYESHLGALYQAATGQGQDVRPPGPLGGDVPPGRQANFRRKALRVILLGTDDRFGSEQDGGGDPFGPPDIPEFRQTAQALRDKGILQIGLAAKAPALKDLRRMAAATGARAPSGGVDCDGDGEVELPRGAPLVCPTSSKDLRRTGIVPAIINSLRAIRDTAAVSLHVSGGEPVTRRVRPGTYRGVVLQERNSLSFAVTFTCRAAHAGKRFAMDVTARAGGAALASARAAVRCGRLPDEPAPPARPPAVPATQIAPGIAVAPAPPPAPVAPELVSQAQSQAQTQAHGQTAAAAQQQEEPQAAAVTLDPGPQGDRAHAMSILRHRRDPAPAFGFLAAGAVLISLAYAFACTARRIDVQRVRGRR